MSEPLAVRALTPGDAEGPLILLQAPLSLWGGLELETGLISDATHPDCGRNIKGAVIAMRAARGSSSSSSALAEAIRRGTAPAAVILAQADPILVIGALVAADLYGVEVPILLLGGSGWGRLKAARHAVIRANGSERYLTTDNPHRRNGGVRPYATEQHLQHVLHLF